MTWIIVILMPLTLAMLSTVVFFFFLKKEKLRRFITIFLFLWVWILATPAASYHITKFWEKNTSPLANMEPSAQAIIILGGGLQFKAADYSNKTVINEYTLSRLNYGVFLYKRQKLPILVTGGDPQKTGTSEGKEMENALETYYSVSPKWVETNSENTFFNAKKSAQILQPEGVKKIYVVTHAWHMPRASLIFKKFGFDVIEAPTRFSEKSEWSILDIIPTADGIAKTSLIVKEMIGYYYYKNCEICHHD